MSGNKSPVCLDWRSAAKEEYCALRSICVLGSQLPSGAELGPQFPCPGLAVLLLKPPVNPMPEPVVQRLELFAGTGGVLKVILPSGDQRVERPDQILER